MSTYLDVFWVGVLNTLIIAIFGIVAATVLGFVLGIFRLSSNFVLRSFAVCYIEVLRNIPLLLQLFFWYFFVLRTLPEIRGKLWLVEGSIGLNITGLYAPFPILQPGFGICAVVFVAGLVAWKILAVWGRRRQAETGQRLPVFWIGLAVVVVPTTLTFLIMGSPLEWQTPIFTEDGPLFRRGFQSDSGFVIKPEMLAVWLALVLYTASFIAEIVRAGVLAVPHGQTEAAYACGCRPGVTLNLVIIPQALRVIIPPLTSQFLNLTKNSSLAVAIAYPDIVSIFAGTALNQVGREIEMIGMMMLVYLFFSIVTSVLMNWFNKSTRLVEH